MHELAITQSVVEAVVERVGERRVTRVRLSVGRLSGVVVDSVRFCFDLVAEGTSLEGAELEVDEPTGHCRCVDCAAEFDVDDPIVLCPRCGSADVDVQSGRDLRIVSVEVSVEVSTACATPAAAPTAAPATKA